MKLLPSTLVFLALAASGCTKKATPEFEATVSDWQRAQCSCYATASDLSSCRNDSERPEAKLSTVEQLMVNAGVLTDARREVVSRAETQVSACARGASTRQMERDLARRDAASQIDFKKLDLSKLGDTGKTTRAR